MRACEALGLKDGFVYDGHIYPCKQFDEYGCRDTETKDKHNIPLPAYILPFIVNYSPPRPFAAIAFFWKNRQNRGS
jgi:hypothetical protein